MADAFDPEMIVSINAQEIDEMVSQFRLRTSTSRLSHRQMQKLFSELPKVTEADLITSGHHDGVCPICFNTLLAILAEEETAHAMDSPAHPVEELGVTKLQKTCGHIFCRRELSIDLIFFVATQLHAIMLTLRISFLPSITKWIAEGHDSCPSCRRPFLTDAERQDNATALPPSQEGWLQHWLADPSMVARNTGLPASTQLPTLSVDPLHALGARGRQEGDSRRDDRDEFAGMYS
ncbi:hypothetical protein BU15DRAFT_70092 [Melanogaster broomeanus]|nr:hypothetical protein BU15DRAFT_70092 [Melanogaster broomeanus]